MSDPQFQVITNGSVGFSVSEVGRDLPEGWQPEGFVGSRSDCVCRAKEMMAPKSEPAEG
jgi:uncharacterized protein YbdZ (MbtH family)